MAHTYTPGLTVTPRTIVSKRRVLPLPGTVLVDAGAVVTSAAVVARAELPGQGVRVETTCALIQGIFGIGGETWGSLVLGVASPEEDVTAAHFTSAHAGKIVVGGAFVGAEALVRAKAVGVKGIVVGGMDDKDLRTLLGYDLGVAITGTEAVGFTRFLTEGFGRIPMADRK